jgi:hypothetical protein
MVARPPVVIAPLTGSWEGTIAGNVRTARATRRGRKGAHSVTGA